MDERTSSRELHFGHFKAATRNRPNILLHYALAEIPFRTGYSPRRWRKATNLMILKKQGIHQVDKLRTIVLYEADFNHNNKFFGKKMMEHMKDNNILAKEQYSVPGKKCIDHVINRRLLFDIVRYKKTSMAMAAVDLKSCYDRVAHAPAYLAMRSYGMPNGPIQSMFETIQEMKFYTRTVHGVSEKTFGGAETGYIAKHNGLGQGNGAGPQIWNAVSSKMFKVLHNRGKTSTIKAPVSKKEMELCGFSFVDDTDLIAMTNGKNDPLEATKKMQQALDDWEKVAKTTGGALEPSKSFVWVVSFQWERGRWQYKEVSKDNRIKISIKDKDDAKVKMKVLNSDKSEKMRGVFLAPDGNNRKQKKSMKEKMVQLGEYIRTGHVSRKEAWTSLNLIAMKSLEYALPAMTYTEDECNELMWPLLKQFLPKAGINRNMKREVVYSTYNMQGLNVKNPFVVQ